MPKGVSLVTGGTGFLGQRLLRKLAAGSEQVRVLVRPSASPEVSSRLPRNGPFELIRCSLTDADGVSRALENVATVYHLAAEARGSYAALTANNVVTSENLYRCVVRSEVSRFVLVSSLAVVSTADLEPESVVDETHGLEKRPEYRDPYTFSKVQQEALAWEYYERGGLPLVVVRPGIIIGPGKNIPNGRMGLQLGRYFLHFGGANVLPLTYVDNCADAVVLAGQRSDLEGKAVIVVDDDLPSSSHVLRRYRSRAPAVRSVRLPYGLLYLLAYAIEMCAERTGGQLPAVLTRYRVASMWKNLKFSNATAKRLLGWQPEIAMRAALERCLEGGDRLSGSQRAQRTCSDTTAGGTGVP